MAKTRYSLVVLSLILLSIAFSSTNVQGTMIAPIEKELKTDVVHDGAPAFQWNLKEIVSDIYRSFSSFAGKVVLIDFFATWCGPCKDAMPLLGEIKDYFMSDSRFVLMSVGVDLADSEAMLEAFAITYDMDWLIFRDTVQMDVYYQIEFIPTLVVINKAQFVAYSEIGMSSVPYIKSVIQEQLDENDTTNPLIASPDTSEDSLSVKNNAVTVSATITDNNLRFVKNRITIGDTQINQEVYTPTEDLVEFDFVIEPTIIWDEMENGATNATIEIFARDFANNLGKETIVLPLTEIVDDTPPVITLDSILVDESGGAKVIVSVDDDTAVKNVSIGAWSSDILLNELEMTLLSPGLYEATFDKVDIAGFDVVEFRVLAYDLSGKATEKAIDHTFAAGLEFTSLIAIVFLSSMIIVPLSRYFSKKKGT